MIIESGDVSEAFRSMTDFLESAKNGTGSGCIQTDRIRALDEETWGELQSPRRRVSYYERSTTLRIDRSFASSLLLGSTPAFWEFFRYLDEDDCPARLMAITKDTSRSIDGYLFEEIYLLSRWILKPVALPGFDYTKQADGSRRVPYSRSFGPEDPLTLASYLPVPTMGISGPPRSSGMSYAPSLRAYGAMGPAGYYYEDAAQTLSLIPEVPQPTPQIEAPKVDSHMARLASIDLDDDGSESPARPRQPTKGKKKPPST